jgi:hypothetical protein
MRNITMIVTLAAVLMATGCDTGGCSGCGAGPVPGGFPLDKRVQGGAQMRLTGGGFRFLRGNLSSIIDLLGSDVMTVEIPASSQDVPLVGTVDFCPAGGCSAQVTVTGIDISPDPPSSVKVVLTAQVATGVIPFTINQGLACLCWEDCQCSVTLDTTREIPAENIFSASITLTVDPVTSYTSIDIIDAAIEDDIQGGDADITNLNLCGLGVCNLLNIGFIKDFVMGMVAGSLASQIEDSTKGMFCRTCGSGCPDGSSCEGETDEDVCIYPGGDCVPSILGLESRIDPAILPIPVDLSGGITPVDMLVGAGGYAQVDTGISLGFLTGTEPAGESPCAAWLPPPLYDPAAEAAVFRQDVFSPCAPCATEEPLCPDGYLCMDGDRCVLAHREVDGSGQPLRCRGSGDCSHEAGFRCLGGLCTYVSGSCLDGAPLEPMVALGVSRKSLEGMIRGAGASGLLCLSLGTPQVPMLTTTTLAMLIPSIANLAWGEYPVAVSTFPGAAPVVEIADWPALTVVLPSFTMDFYAWIHTTYTRIFTVRGDVRAALSITPIPEGPVISVETIELENVNISNSGLLREDAERLNDLFASLINDLLPALLGTATFGPVGLPQIVEGLTPVIPQGGIRHVGDSGEDFLTILLDLELTTESGPAPDGGLPALDTAASLTSRGFAAPLPFFDFELSAGGARETDAVEYSTRIDDMLWSGWRGEASVSLSDPIFLIDGKHGIGFRARVAGKPGTEDPTPAVIEVTVDTHGPLLRLDEGGTAPVAEALDAVSPAAKISMRLRYLPGPSAWVSASSPARLDPPPGADGVEVEATDEAGNTSAAVFGLTSAAAPAGDPAAPQESGGCGCGIAGRDPAGASGLFVALLLAAAVLFTKRRGAFPTLLLALAVASASAAGCTFETSIDRPGCRSDDDCYPEQRCCPGTGRCIDAPDLAGFCDDGFHCDADPAFDEGTCTFGDDCCVENEPLDPGRTGSYTSFDTAPDGTVWVSGYSEGASPSLLFGDLVVGRFVEGSGVDWEIADGLPARGEVEGAPSGWRGGVVTPGDDVGLWTSTVVTGDGVVAFYYDKTHGSLKVARGNFSGGPFTSYVVDDYGDAGTMTSALLVGGVTPAVVYRAVVEDSAEPGKFSSEVRYAYALDASLSSFAVETAASAPAPCWKELCSGSALCRYDTGRCEVPQDEALCHDGDGCESNQRCYDGACVRIVDWVTDIPSGIGLFSSAVLDPWGTVQVLCYDGTAGDLVLLSRGDGGWGAPVVLDGWDDDPLTAGDRGLDPSLAVDPSGGLHASYGDGTGSMLYYMNVGAALVETVDDGTGTPGERHRVGFNSAVGMDAAGRIRIAFQDSSSGRLFLAVRVADGTWVKTDVSPGEGAWGYYMSQKIAGPADLSTIASFFVKNLDEGIAEGVSLLFCSVDGSGVASCI